MPAAVEWHFVVVPVLGRGDQRWRLLVSLSRKRGVGEEGRREGSIGKRAQHETRLAASLKRSTSCSIGGRTAHIAGIAVC